MKHLKILGLSLLALVGVLAVNASAAQAVWVLNGGTNTGGVLDLKLKGQILLGQLLVAGIGLKIHCDEGAADVLLITNAAMTVLTGSGTATFTGCDVEEFEEVCEVMSPGKPSGTIFASGTGEGKMASKAKEAETFAKLTNSNFSTILFEGEECPFIGLEEAVNGSVRLVVNTPETVSATHTATINEEGLFFGEEAALLDGPGAGNSALVHVTKEGGGSWAVQLTGL